MPYEFLKFFINFENNYEKPTIVNEIKEVRYNGPATIVFWRDGKKTVSVCSDDDTYDYEKGLAMCILKYLIGDGSFNEAFRKFAPAVNEHSKEDINEDSKENRQIIENLLNTKKLTETQKAAIKSLL